MATIALFCEGASEIKILTYIIAKYLGDDISVNALQPEMSFGRQTSPGGWYEVLRHCNNEDFNNALATNDYLIIQIDTDSCSQIGFDVNEYDENGHRVNDELLYNRVVNRLLRDLSPELLDEYCGRILFAVCINETECWLLPFYYEKENPDKCAATNNCIHHLNRKLSRDRLGIPKKDKNSPNAIKVYQKVLRTIKQRDIRRLCVYNWGFNKFIEQLDAIRGSMANE